MKTLSAVCPAILTLALVVAASGTDNPTAMSSGIGSITKPVPVQSAYAPEFSSSQLDNLVAPVALYPDPLLAQVLPAATFPDQIAQAAQWRSQNPDPRAIDGMTWDVSVKAIAHYPAVLNRMSSQIDWTTALGQAYVNQPDDVMASVQRLRGMARAEGNLISTPQQQVLVNSGYIAIDPIQPRYIFVPQYDPAVVYVRHGGPGLIAFSAGLVIGAWLNHDFDWGRHRVFYTGWQGGGWIARSRPEVQISNVYVNNNYTNVQVNRTVVQRPVNYAALNRQSAVHANVNFNNVAAARAAAPAGRPAGAAPAARAAQPAAQPGRPAPEVRTPERSAAPAARPAPAAPVAHNAAPAARPVPAPRAAAPERAPQPAPRAATPERAPQPMPRVATPERTPQPAPARPAPAPRASAPERAPQPAPRASAPERAPQPAPRAAAPERAQPAPAPHAAAPAHAAPPAAHPQAAPAKPAPEKKEPPKPGGGGGDGPLL